MVKAEGPWPRLQHVARQSPYLNNSCTLLEPSLCAPLAAYVDSSACIFPAISEFPGFTAPAIPSLKTELTDEVQGFLQNPHSEPCLKETYTGGPTQNATPASLQKKLLIFDHSGNETRLFYSPVFPLAERPIFGVTKFPQAYDVNEEKQTTTMGQKYLTRYNLPEGSDEDRIVDEESAMHEDTEEINALLDSDDVDYDNDDDEVKSTGHSPVIAKRTYMMQEWFEDTKEKVASSDWPNKRKKLIDGGNKRLSSTVDNASLVRPNDTVEYVSDAESKSSSGQVYSAGQTKEDNSILGDILKKDKIRESLRDLENLVPGVKGKQPLLVIDGTIEYLKSLMSQIGTLEVKYH